MGSPTAVEKGFFGDLEVKVAGGGPGLSPIDRVMAETKGGGIAFGVDYPYNVLEAREKQKLPLVVVAHDFQKSAVRLISWKELKSPRDIEGTVATWIGYDKQIKAAIGPDWEKRIRVVNQQGDPATLGSWLKKDYPFAHAMLYNEVLVARRMAKDKYWQYSFADFGIDWPENVVFTTEDIVQKHPKVVQAFVAGRYRGYKHALADRQDAVRTLVFVTHSIEEAVFLSDRVVVMSRGRSALSGSSIARVVKVDLPRPRPLALKEEVAFFEKVREGREALREG